MYMTNEALRLKNRKNKMWKRYQATGGIYDRTSFVSAKNKLRNLTRKLRRDFETKIAQNAKDNPKQFWGYMKSRLKTRPKIPALRKADGSTASNPKDKADLLNEFFSGVFTIENSDSPLPKTQEYNEAITTILITPDCTGKID